MPWVHCNSHGAVHHYEVDKSPWCTAVYTTKLYGEDGWAPDSTHLNYNGDDTHLARREAHDHDLWLSSPYKEIEMPEDYKPKVKKINEYQPDIGEEEQWDELMEVHEVFEEMPGIEEYFVPTGEDYLSGEMLDPITFIQNGMIDLTSEERAQVDAVLKAAMVRRLREIEGEWPPGC